MGSKVTIYANSPPDSANEDARDAPDLPEKGARARADKGTKVLSCNSIDTFVDCFKEMKRALAPVSYLEIICHGMSGYLFLGAENFNAEKVVRVDRQEFDKAFDKNATVMIYGCAVASGALGELFLATIAPILLGVNGGGLSGSKTKIGLLTIAGWSPGWTVGAEWMTAWVSPGGGVTLTNASHLIPKQLRNRLVGYRQDISGPSKWSTSSEMTSNRRIALEKKLQQAADALGPESRMPSYREMYTAAQRMEDLEGLMEAIFPGYKRRYHLI